MKIKSLILIFSVFVALPLCSFAQPVSGVWHGKIKKQGLLQGRAVQLELKLIRNGNNLTGTSYYYTSENNYTAFSVKGYFDPFSGTVTWWDDFPMEDGNVQAVSQPLHYVADFNCPGEGIMKLDGIAEPLSSDDEKTLEIHLNKVSRTNFPDEWDLVLEDMKRGIFDSAAIVTTSRKNEPVRTETPVIMPSKETVSIIRFPASVSQSKPASAPPTIEQMFTARKKNFVTEIPLAGDSVELNFYDHAEIDGDSISLFLNNQLIYKNVLLKAQPFTVKLAVKDLDNSNELIMVAENLGSIPPNTSLMIAWINGIRYEARLESDENSSAMIRFIKPSLSSTSP